LPNLNRRGFLGLLGGVAAVAPVATPEADADLQRRGLWTFRWHGWREPVNQAVTIGFWTATRSDFAYGWYATTGGYVERFYEFECLLLSHKKDWPPLTAMEHCALSEAEWDARKTQLRANALRILVEKIRG
jgi:hypothetical protein